MGNAGDGDEGDLAARVARLERALGAAGAVMADGRAGGVRERTPAEKGLRTVVQVVVAAISPMALAAAGAMPPIVATTIALLATPVVTYVQNELEQRGTIPTLLGAATRPPPADVDLAP